MIECEGSSGAIIIIMYKRWANKDRKKEVGWPAIPCSWNGRRRRRGEGIGCGFTTEQ